MLLKFKRGKQKALILKAIKISGSERKLCAVTGISKAAIYRYKFEIVAIPEERLRFILKILKEDMAEYEEKIIKKIPENWGMIKGGINCVRKKKQDGTYKKAMENLQLGSSNYMKKWHSEMKKNNPGKYHVWQYERFKKIGGGYKHRLTNGTKVRNILEQKVGDFLLKEYENILYEPYIMIGNKTYFPDFKYKNKIVEVTEWKHPQPSKLEYLNDNNKVFCFFCIRKLQIIKKKTTLYVFTSQLNTETFINYLNVQYFQRYLL